MWRIQGGPILIDLGNDIFIVKLIGREEYLCALSEGSWMIGDNYLHVQRCQPNFVAEEAKIFSLPVWARFPQLPVEYYTVDWLIMVGNNIGEQLR